MKYFIFISFCVFFINCKNPSVSKIANKEKSLDTLIKKTKLIIQNKYSKPKINYNEQDTLRANTGTFSINEQSCFWEITLFVFEGANGGSGSVNLVNNKTGKTILNNGDFFSADIVNSINQNARNFIGEFIDFNFDGKKDFIVYSKTGSGSGGAFFKVYLFNNKKHIFEFSEELSGGEFNVDTDNKTVRTHWKMGVGWHASRVHHFDIKGKLKYTEQTIYEAITVDSIGLWEKTYTKIINNEIVKKEIDTTEIDW